MGARSFVARLARRLADALDGRQAEGREDALRRQVEFTNELFDSVPLALAMRDRAGKYLFVNRTWEKYFGERREKVVGVTLHQRLRPEEADRVFALDRAAIERGPGAVKSEEFDFRGRKFMQTRTVMADGRGRAVGVLVATLEITERLAQEERLREQIALTQAIVAQTPNAIFAKDRAGRFTLANRGWSAMSGVPAEKAIGRTVHELYPEATAKRFAEEDEKLLAQGTSAPAIESLHQGPRPGQYRIVRKAVLSKDDGTVLGLVCSSTDISELKHMEEALAAERQRLALVVNATQAGIIDWDIGTETPWYSERFREMLGYAGAESAALPAIFGGLVHRDDRDRCREVFFSGLVDRGAPHAVTVQKPLELRLRRADGSWLWVESMGLTLRDEAGEAKRYLAAVTDITERRAAAEALATEQRRLDLVVRASSIGTLDWDGVTRGVYYSPRFKEILGYAPDADTTGWPDGFDGLVHPDDRELAKKAFRDHILGTGAEGKTERHPTLEYRLRRADGSYVWVETQGISVRDEKGFCTRFTASYTDITGRRAHEEALKDSMRLREEVERMSRHDLKTPLNSVIAVSRLLRDGGKLSREDEELLSIVERAGYRILSMVNLSLDLYRMESGTYQFRPQSIDLMDVARKVAADLEGHAASKDVALRLRQSGGSLARAEELLCYSMLANLVKNAIEAVPEGGVVSVTVEGAGDTVSVHVHNAGAVPAAIRARFFDKYASSGKSAGLGLGTYSARLMARTQEGDITLHTSEADGTTVSVRLGASRQPAEGTASPAPAATGTRAERLPELAPQRVLVVDDDEFNRLVLRRYLPSPPLTVAMAVNGRAAIEAARADWPDVVLLDLEMPVMDGYEAAEKLRELEREGRGKLTIVAVSSNDDDAIVQRAMAAGCDHYLVKPAPRELLFRMLAGEKVSSEKAKPFADGPAPARVEIEPRLKSKLPAFLESRRALLDDAAAAARSGERETLRRCAHRLAGSFGLFGFEWASAAARRVENGAAQGDLAELGARLEAVGAHLNEVEISFGRKVEERR